MSQIVKLHAMTREDLLFRPSHLFVTTIKMISCCITEKSSQTPDPSSSEILGCHLVNESLLHSSSWYRNFCTSPGICVANRCGEYKLMMRERKN